MINYNLFRGTNEYEKNNYNKNKRFFESIGDRNYLGDGVYFFRDDCIEAENWTINNIKPKHNSDCYIASTEISVKEEEVFDFTNRENYKEYAKLIEYFFERFNNGKYDMIVKEPYDGHIVNYYCSKNKNIKLVSAIFQLKDDKMSLYKKKNFTRIFKCHCQICVKNQSIFNNEVLWEKI